MPADSDTPELKLLQDQISVDTECGRPIRDDATAVRLKPVFVTRINRSAIPLRLPPGDELEVALDDGTVEVDSSSVARGWELELKRGQP